MTMVYCIRAARGKRAASGQSGQIRRLALDRLQLPCWVVDPRDRLEQAARVGVARISVHIEDAAALYDIKEHRVSAVTYGTDLLAVSLYWLGVAMWGLGLPEQAMSQQTKAVDHARLVSHSGTLGSALWY